MVKKPRDNIEKYLLVVSEIVLILLFALLFYQGHYVYGLVCFIGAILIWLFENGETHLTLFWTLLITGAFFILIIGNILLGIVLIFFAIGEMYLNDALKGSH